MKAVGKKRKSPPPSQDRKAPPRKKLCTETSSDSGICRSRLKNFSLELGKLVEFYNLLQLEVEKWVLSSYEDGENNYQILSACEKKFENLCNYIVGYMARYHNFCASFDQSFDTDTSKLSDEMVERVENWLEYLLGEVDELEDGDVGVPQYLNSEELRVTFNFISGLIRREKWDKVFILWNQYLTGHLTEELRIVPNYYMCPTHLDHPIIPFHGFEQSRIRVKLVELFDLRPGKSEHCLNNRRLCRSRLDVGTLLMMMRRMAGEAENYHSIQICQYKYKFMPMNAIGIEKYLPFITKDHQFLILQDSKWDYLTEKESSTNIPSSWGLLSEYMEQCRALKMTTQPSDFLLPVIIQEEFPASLAVEGDIRAAQWFSNHNSVYQEYQTMVTMTQRWAEKNNNRAMKLLLPDSFAYSRMYSGFYHMYQQTQHPLAIMNVWLIVKLELTTISEETRLRLRTDVSFGALAEFVGEFWEWIQWLYSNDKGLTLKLTKTYPKEKRSVNWTETSQVMVRTGYRPESDQHLLRIYPILGPNLFTIGAPSNIDCLELSLKRALASLIPFMDSDVPLAKLIGMLKTNPVLSNCSSFLGSTEHHNPNNCIDHTLQPLKPISKAAREALEDIYSRVPNGDCPYYTSPLYTSKFLAKFKDGVRAQLKEMAVPKMGPGFRTIPRLNLDFLADCSQELCTNHNRLNLTATSVSSHWQLSGTLLNYFEMEKMDLYSKLNWMGQLMLNFGSLIPGLLNQTASWNMNRKDNRGQLQRLEYDGYAVYSLVIDSSQLPSIIKELNVFEKFQHTLQNFVSTAPIQYHIGNSSAFGNKIDFQVKFVRLHNPGGDNDCKNRNNIACMMRLFAALEDAMQIKGKKFFPNLERCFENLPANILDWIVVASETGQARIDLLGSFMSSIADFAINRQTMQPLFNPDSNPELPSSTSICNLGRLRNHILKRMNIECSEQTILLFVWCKKMVCNGVMYNRPQQCIVSDEDLRLDLPHYISDSDMQFIYLMQNLYCSQSVEMRKSTFQSLRNTGLLSTLYPRLGSPRLETFLREYTGSRKLLAHHLKKTSSAGSGGDGSRWNINLGGLLGMIFGGSSANESVTTYSSLKAPEFMTFVDVENYLEKHEEVSERDATRDSFLDFMNTFSSKDTNKKTMNFRSCLSDSISYSIYRTVDGNQQRVESAGAGIDRNVSQNITVMIRKQLLYQEKGADGSVSGSKPFSLNGYNFVGAGTLQNWYSILLMMISQGLGRNKEFYIPLHPVYSMELSRLRCMYHRIEEKLPDPLDFIAQLSMTPHNFSRFDYLEPIKDHQNWFSKNSRGQWTTETRMETTRTNMYGTWREMEPWVQMFSMIVRLSLQNHFEDGCNIPYTICNVVDTSKSGTKKFMGDSTLISALEDERQSVSIPLYKFTVPPNEWANHSTSSSSSSPQSEHYQIDPTYTPIPTVIFEGISNIMSHHRYLFSYRSEEAMATSTEFEEWFNRALNKYPDFTFITIQNARKRLNNEGIEVEESRVLNTKTLLKNVFRSWPPAKKCLMLKFCTGVAEGLKRELKSNPLDIQITSYRPSRNDYITHFNSFSGLQQKASDWLSIDSVLTSQPDVRRRIPQMTAQALEDPSRNLHKLPSAHTCARQLVLDDWVGMMFMSIVTYMRWDQMLNYVDKETVDVLNTVIQNDPNYYSAAGYFDYYNVTDCFFDVIENLATQFLESKFNLCFTTDCSDFL